MYSLDAQGFVVGSESFDDIFRIPSCDSTFSTGMQKLYSFRGAVQRLKLQDDSMVQDSTCEHSVRRCRSDSTDSNIHTRHVSATWKDDSIETLRSELSLNKHHPSSRALHNLCIGLLTHHESIKARRRLQDTSSTSEPVNLAHASLISSSCRLQDELWDQLLQ
jgi:hypothetical protein